MQEMARVLSGVDVMLIETDAKHFFLTDMGKMFFHRIMASKLLKNSNFLVIRIIGNLDGLENSEPMEFAKSRGFYTTRYKGNSRE